jgi:hypothetical protein
VKDFAMPELPDSFFGGREQDKSVPGATSTQPNPYDNSTNNIDQYLAKAQPPVSPAKLQNGKIPAGENIREDLYYDYEARHMFPRFTLLAAKFYHSGDCGVSAMPTVAPSREKGLQSAGRVRSWGRRYASADPSLS